MYALNRLSARAVPTIKSEGRHSDGGGLYLQIKNGGRSWLFLYRCRASGRLREMGMGSAAAVALADARIRAAHARKLLTEGKDPIGEKQALRAAAQRRVTFGDFADGFVEKLLPGFKNAKHRYQWEQTLKGYAAPLRGMFLDEIKLDDVRKVLDPIWRTKHETASRLRGRLEQIFAAAKASGLREGENPGRWKDGLQPFYGSVKRSRVHHPALPWSEMPAFMGELRALKYRSAEALEFLILTAARTSEVTGATWDEIDFETKVWTIPGNRMKGGKPHEVPLTVRAIAVLGKPGKGVIFKNQRGGAFSDAAMRKCFNQLRDGYTVHGFRSSFRDWCGDQTSFPREVAEAALAHIVGGVEGSYRRGTALDKRRELMANWAQYLSGDVGNVTVLASKRKAS